MHESGIANSVIEAVPKEALFIGGTMNRVPLEQKVLSENDRLAGELRERFREHGVLCLNLISSPGSGKTTSLLLRTRAHFAA